MSSDATQGSTRQPVAGMPQQRHRQGSSTFGSGSGSGEGRGTDNIYNFDEEEFQDDSFGSLRMGQKKSSFSSSQTSSSGNNTNSNKFSGGTGRFGSQDSSDDDFPMNSTSSSGMPSQSSSQMSSQSELKSSSIMNQQSSSNFTGMSAMSGRGGSSAMGNAMRQQPQYSNANMGLRQQGPMIAGGRGNMIQTGMRGGMGSQMGQMHPQRMHNMQAQRMQMQSQQHMQHTMIIIHYMHHGGD